jgi:uncharacterized protein
MVLEYGGKKVAVNPELGGWAVVSRRELAALLNPSGYVSAEIGEQGYRHGIVRKNGHSVYDPSAQEDRMFFFEFHVADVCNLACVYCAASTTPAKQIPPTDPKVGRKWVDRVLEHCEAEEIRNIDLEFTGGEPLANVDFLDRTLDYWYERSSELGVDAKIIVVSNLTQIGVRQIEFLRKHNVVLNFSLDGTQMEHDAHRPFAAGRGSYRAVLKNLKRLRELGLDPLSVQSVITSHNVQRLPQIAESILDLGFEQMTLQHVFMAGTRDRPLWLLPDPELYVSKLFELFEEHYVPCWERTGLMPHTRYLGLAYAYLLEPKRTYMCQRSPCGAGRCITAVNPKGDVHGCAIGPWTDEFRMGNIFEDSFAECQRSAAARASAARHFRHIEGCNRCMFRGWCQSGCPKDAFSVHESIQARPSLCRFYRELWGRALETLVEETYPREAVRAIAGAYLH